MTMAYTKFENGHSVEVTEAEHLREFMDSVHRIEPGTSDVVCRKSDFELITFMLKFGNLPDSIRRRAISVMNSVFYGALTDCESRIGPKKRKFCVTFDVKRAGVHTIEVEAEDEREASRIAQETIDTSKQSPATFPSSEFLGADITDIVEADDGR